MMSPISNTAPRLNRTICMHFCQAQYYIIIQNSFQFRVVVDTAIKEYPELFPVEISSGYKMKEIRFSKKLNLKIRRIVIAGVSYTIRPSFAMPYMTGFVQDVEKPLFLRKFAVSFWALSYCFGCGYQIMGLLQGRFQRVILTACAQAFRMVSK